MFSAFCPAYNRNCSIDRVNPGESLFDLPPVQTEFPLIEAQCDCSPNKQGEICPLTSSFKDIVPTIHTSEESTLALFKAQFPEVVHDGDHDIDRNGQGYNTPLPDLPQRQPRRKKRQTLENIPTLNFEMDESYGSPIAVSEGYYFEPDYNTEIGDPEVALDWPSKSGISEAEASNVCAKTLFDNPLASACGEYLGEKLQLAYDYCMTDILIKDDLSWAQYGMPLLENLCEAIILREIHGFLYPGDALPQWPAELVNAFNCPEGCNHGNCTRSGCLCERGYRGKSCAEGNMLSYS